MKTWYQIQAKANNPKSAEVSIHDEIGLWGISASAFMRDLKAMGDVDDIHLSIHSPGGDVLDGWAIYNALRNSKARITARVEGLAASMASVILMAADEIQIPKNAYVMIHNPWGMAVGDAEEMRDTAALLDKLQGGLVRAYSDRTGNDESDIRAWMDAETWMDGEEAVERGFATVLLDEVAMSAKAFDTRRFKMTPTSVQANSEEDPLVAPMDETPLVAPVEETPVEAPVAEVAVEETPDESPTEEPQAKSLLSRIAALFGGSATDETLKAELANKDDQIQSSLKVIDSLKAQVTELQIKAQAFDEAQAAIATLEAERKTAEAKAAAQIAAAGFDPESESKLPPAEADKGDILAQFNELTGAEKTAFYRAHSKAIKQAQSNL
jgi:ATP-dependent Clp endopeptidase proteolytic subunit ClpP